MSARVPNPDTTYEGRPCSKGHGRLRYKNNSACIVCARLASAAAYKPHPLPRVPPLSPEGQRELNRIWSQNNKERRKRVRRQAKDYLPRRYGITLEQYNNMLAEQGYCCAICSKVASPHRAFCVDHNHDTGKIRGLLCDGCNNGIGQLKDSQELLQKAIEYLRERSD